MRRALTLCLLVVLALWAATPLAQGPPFAQPQVTPAWTAVPGVAAVYYAPNTQMDLFRHQGRYYCHQGGLWYRAQVFSGPWQEIKQVPAPFYQIDAAYFRTPPGWAKGKKTGWKGGTMPPGQMKKWNKAP